MADKIVDLLPRFAAPATPRYGAYDPEADLIDAYGVQPLMPSMVDPTMGGYSTRNPGFSIAAENPGVPVILPTTVPTNPNRYMKGARYDSDYGDFVPTFEARNPMAPNIPMGTLSDESRSNPALIGAALGGAIPQGVGRGMQAAARSKMPRLKADQAAASQQYERVLSGEPLDYGTSAANQFYQHPRTFDSFRTATVDDRLLPVNSVPRYSENYYVPRSSKTPFPDRRFEDVVTKETPMMVPRYGAGADRFGVKYKPNPYQSADEYFSGAPITGPPEAFPNNMYTGKRALPGYKKVFKQEGYTRGGYPDDVAEASRMGYDLANQRVNRAMAMEQAGGTAVGPGSIGGTIGGGLLGELYSETLGEGDTRYYDPSGSERAMLRSEYAQYPGMTPPPPKMRITKMRLNDFPMVKSILKGENDFQVMPLGPGQTQMEYGPYQVMDPYAGGM